MGDEVIDLKDEKKQELMDILDCNGNPTGEVHVRGSGSAHHGYVGAVTVCVINSQGQMLIQQRVNDKGWGGLWDVTCGGAMTHGETPQMSAMREVKEEMGLDIDLTGVRPSLITTFSNGFSFCFVVNRDVEMEEVVLQKEEVQDARFASKEEILALLKEERFVPYRPSWVEYVFDFARQEFVF